MPLRFRYPVLTMLVIGICSLVFISVRLEPPSADWHLARYWMTQDPGQIWDGAWWALLGSAFFHYEPLHLIFNMLWLWTFGSRIERVMGVQVLLALVVCSALIGSAAELIVGNWPVIGASGIVYALFGFMWGIRRRVPIFYLVITPQLVRFLLAWLIFCFVLTYFDILPIGNLAHLSGLAFGICAAHIMPGQPRRWAAALGLGFLGAMTIVAVTWTPWLPAYRKWQAIEARKAGDYATMASILDSQLDRHDPVSLNEKAWQLATARDARFRDGKQATVLALEANRLTGWIEPSLIDTLAAAYAEAGRWDEAERYQRMALQELDKHMSISSDYSAARASLQHNMDLIKKRQKIRE